MSVIMMWMKKGWNINEVVRTLCLLCHLLRVAMVKRRMRMKSSHLRFDSLSALPAPYGSTLACLLAHLLTMGPVGTAMSEAQLKRQANRPAVSRCLFRRRRQRSRSCCMNRPDYTSAEPLRWCCRPSVQTGVTMATVGEWGGVIFLSVFTKKSVAFFSLEVESWVETSPPIYILVWPLNNWSHSFESVSLKLASVVNLSLWSKGEKGPMVEATLKLGIALLNGGNTSVQQVWAYIITRVFRSLLILYC